MNKPSAVNRAWDAVRAVARSVAAGGFRGAEDAEGGVRVRADGTWTAMTEVDLDTRNLLDLYLPLALRRRLVIGQLGQSLDGRVATASGASHYVTGPEDIHRLHRVRALVDAVIVGAGTATADRPQLTVRKVEGRNPVRVILDPRGRVPPVGPLFDDPAALTLWIRQGTPDRALRSHVDVVCPPPAGPDQRIRPADILDLLRRRGYGRILVEGGGATVSGFLAARALDRLHVTVAPLIIGAGPHGLTLPPIETLDDALRPRTRYFEVGADILFDLDFTPLDPGRSPEA